MKRIKFLMGEAGPLGFFEPGQIVEMEDKPAEAILKRMYPSGPLAIEVKPTVCPNCGHQIQEEQGPSGAPEALEAATVSHSPRRRG